MFKKISTVMGPNGYAALNGVKPSELQVFAKMANDGAKAFDDIGSLFPDLCFKRDTLESSKLLEVVTAYIMQDLCTMYKDPKSTYKVTNINQAWIKSGYQGKAVIFEDEKNIRFGLFDLWVKVQAYYKKHVIV